MIEFEVIIRELEHSDGEIVALNAHLNIVEAERARLSDELAEAHAKLAVHTASQAEHIGSTDDVRMSASADIAVQRLSAALEQSQKDLEAARADLASEKAQWRRHVVEGLRTQREQWALAAREERRQFVEEVGQLLYVDEDAQLSAQRQAEHFEAARRARTSAPLPCDFDPTAHCAALHLMQSLR